MLSKQYSIATLVRGDLRECRNIEQKPPADNMKAQQASSEEGITMNRELCGNPRQGFMDQIRADFTTCSLPSDSLSTGCVSGDENEPANCGFSANLQGLCGYCASSSPNSTDSCCTASNVNNVCPGVTLPSTTSLPPLFPSSTSRPSPSSSAAAGTSRDDGLSGGQMAGIVVGSVLGAAVILGLLLLCCFYRRRQRGGSQASVFNQPNPQRSTTAPMAYAPPQPTSQTLPPDYRPQSGGRVARMSAMEGNSSDSPSYGNIGAIAGAAATQKRYGDTSDSDAFNDTPESRLGGAPRAGKRGGSLSSQSALGALDDHSSPNTEGQVSSPDGVTSGQSEQLPFFKDYYSQDEIHPNDKVSVLWAYQPRAGDEFELERGDMLKVVGIWDDGWATGVRINERAEDYEGKHKVHRDSGVSSASRRRDSSPTGELKAFPLVCVCLPEHWKQTIVEEQGSDEEKTSLPARSGP